MIHTINDFRFSDPNKGLCAFLRCPYEECSWESSHQSWVEESPSGLIREAELHLGEHDS